MLITEVHKFSPEKKSWNKDPEGSQKSPKSNMQSKMHFPSLIILLILSLFFSSFNLIFLSEELLLPFKRNNVVSSRIIGKYSAEVHSTCFTLCDNVLQSFQLMWKKKSHKSVLTLCIQHQVYKYSSTSLQYIELLQMFVFNK